MPLIKSNPYRPGTARMPPYLAGCDGIIEAFEQTLDGFTESEATSWTLTGLRGAGKSCTLRALQAVAEEPQHGWVAVRSEWSPAMNTDVRRFQECVLADVQLAAEKLSAMQTVKRLAQDNAPSISSLSVPTPIGAVKVEFDHREKPSPVFARQLATEMRKLGRLAKASGRGVVLMWDEAHVIKDAPKSGKTPLGDLLSAILAAQEDDLPVFPILCGLPSLRSHLKDARSNTERAMTHVTVGNLDRESAVDALTIPAQQRGYAFEQRAARTLAVVTAGYPYFLQAAGKSAWDVAVAMNLPEIDTRVLPLAIKRFRTKMDRDFFPGRFEEASRADQAVMSAAGSLGGEAFDVQDLLRALPDRSENAVRLSVNRMYGLGLCYPEPGGRGTWHWAVPLFGDYLRRQHPLDRSEGTRSEEGLGVADGPGQADVARPANGSHGSEVIDQLLAAPAARREQERDEEREVG